MYEQFGVELVGGIKGIIGRKVVCSKVNNKIISHFVNVQCHYRLAVIGGMLNLQIISIGSLGKLSDDDSHLFFPGYWV